jgi:hypothetical protein
MPDRYPAKLVMGESPACFDAIADLGVRPAALMRRRVAASSRDRRSLLNTAIAFIRRQHGSGSPWVCYLGPAGRFDAVEAAGDQQPRRRPFKPM